MSGAIKRILEEAKSLRENERQELALLIQGLDLDWTRENRWEREMAAEGFMSLPLSSESSTPVEQPGVLEDGTSNIHSEMLIAARR
jgi:hypothetical protein